MTVKCYFTIVCALIWTAMRKARASGGWCRGASFGLGIGVLVVMALVLPACAGKKGDAGKEAGGRMGGDSAAKQAAKASKGNTGSDFDALIGDEPDDQEHDVDAALDSAFAPADLRTDLMKAKGGGAGTNSRFRPAAGASTERLQAPRVGLGNDSINQYWTIVIKSFDAALDADLAQQALVKVQTVGRLPEAELQVRGKAIAVVYGRFPAVEDAKAQAELKRVKNLEVDGAKPFALAVLMPPTTVEAGSGEGSLDLRTARQVNPDAKYTLQVGSYEWAAGAPQAEIEKARQAAEQAAKTLRKEGTEAYYYHGLRSSLVTAGLFSEEDVDPDDVFSINPELTKLRKQFPHHLVNGQGVRMRRPGMGDDPNSWPMVPSKIVNLPE